MTNIAERENDDLRTDMPVEAVFDSVSEQTMLIRLKPASCARGPSFSLTRGVHIDVGRGL